MKGEVGLLQYNVLVTSIGGDLGKAVCKSLKYSAYNIKILGTDCLNYVPYPIFCDEFLIIPKAENSGYIDFISNLILQNSIDIVYVCSEQELLYICDNFHMLSKEIRTRIAIPPIEVINMCRDKYKTMEFLKDNKFPYPKSIVYDKLIKEEELLKNFRYPFIVKKTVDCGSKHFHVIRDINEFRNIADLDCTYMLQEYIPGIEYTNAVYKDAFTGEIYVITLERSLKDGMSYEVKVVSNKEIKELCIEVAKKIKLSGSINIQLRKQDEGAPIIFEINPRYSSTAFMRARFGFNDVIFAFENIVLKKAISKPQIKRGEAYRYITEYYKFY